MIVVDTSALIAIVKNEPLGDICLSALVTASRRFISAATLTEAYIVAGQKGLTAALDTLLAMADLEIVVVDEIAAALAADAYVQWGRNYHEAKLNFGDCFAYALAKSRNCPLLYIGNDFAQTDIVSAIEPSPHG